MPRLDPFSFCAAHASAIVGLGGQDPAPDPNYVFHTDYTDLEQGFATFEIRVVNARASYGQLTIRVHHHKEGHDAGLVTSTQVLLYNIDNRDLAVTLRFRAVEGVRYALFAYYNEPSDLEADAVEVEYETESIESIATRRRETSARGAVAQLSQAVKLVKVCEPSLATPVSQPYAPGQSEGGLTHAGADRLYWANALVINALSSLGIAGKGVRGAVVGSISPRLRNELTASGCEVEIRTPASLRADDAGPADLDFIAGLQDECSASMAHAAEWVDALADEVAHGGVVVAILRLPALGNAIADRNGIQQIALRLIGLGYDVAQLCFPRNKEWASPADDEIWFAAILRRPIR